MPELPDWVADFLNRRTEVEHVLRAPMNVRKRNARGIRHEDDPAPLTPEQMWDLANKLSVPTGFGAVDDPEKDGG